MSNAISRTEVMQQYYYIYTAIVVKDIFFNLQEPYLIYAIVSAATIVNRSELLFDSEFFAWIS
jgi:hypothetical protein